MTEKFKGFDTEFPVLVEEDIEQLRLLFARDYCRQRMKRAWLSKIKIEWALPSLAIALLVGWVVMSIVDWWPAQLLVALLLAMWIYRWSQGVSLIDTSDQAWVSYFQEGERVFDELLKANGDTIRPLQRDLLRRR